ncbi:hypothetical protein N9O65_01275 [Schleiferiaceae bacterium]|nr:hypothetical protein [Schleiferiaceae bacterium]
MIICGQNANVLKVQQGVRFTSFTMTTQNGLFGPYGSLTDYYANALGLDYLPLPAATVPEIKSQSGFEANFSRAYL